MSLVTKLELKQHRINVPILRRNILCFENPQFKLVLSSQAPLLLFIVWLCDTTETATDVTAAHEYSRITTKLLHPTTPLERAVCYLAYHHKVLRKLFNNQSITDWVSTLIVLQCKIFYTANTSLYRLYTFTHTHTHTHTHPFNGPFSRTTRVSQYQKGKTITDSS